MNKIDKTTAGQTNTILKSTALSQTDGKFSVTDKENFQKGQTCKITFRDIDRL